MGSITRVKSCCIVSLKERRLAVDAVASAIGLVSTMPSGPGVIDEARMAKRGVWMPPSFAVREADTV